MKAIHKQTGEIKTGSFTDLCNLDKRIWDLQSDEEPEPQLIYVTVVDDMGGIDDETGEYVEKWFYYEQGVRDWTELEGYYIGGH